MRFALFLAMILAAAAAPAQTYRVGDAVVAARRAAVMRGNREVFSVYPGLVMRVAAINGRWLWVAEPGSGWIDAAEVIALDRAQDYFTHLVDREPANVDYRYARALVLLEEEKLDPAIADLTELVKIEPDRAAFWHLRGLAWFDKLECYKAIKDLNEAIRLNPKLTGALVGRATVSDYVGAHDRAIADFNAALALEPGASAAHCGLAWIYATCPEAQFRDGRRAVEHAQRGCELTRWKRYDLVEALAAAHAESGNFAEAVRWQTKAIALDGGANRADLDEELALYQQRKPNREGPKAD